MPRIVSNTHTRGGFEESFAIVVDKKDRVLPGKEKHPVPWKIPV